MKSTHVSMGAEGAAITPTQTKIGDADAALWADKQQKDIEMLENFADNEARQREEIMSAMNIMQNLSNHAETSGARVSIGEHCYLSCGHENELKLLQCCAYDCLEIHQKMSRGSWHISDGCEDKRREFNIKQPSFLRDQTKGHQKLCSRFYQSCNTTNQDEIKLWNAEQISTSQENSSYLESEKIFSSCNEIKSDVSRRPLHSPSRKIIPLASAISQTEKKLNLHDVLFDGTIKEHRSYRQIRHAGLDVRQDCPDEVRCQRKRQLPNAITNSSKSSKNDGSDSVSWTYFNPSLKSDLANLTTNIISSLFSREISHHTSEMQLVQEALRLSKQPLIPESCCSHEPTSLDATKHPNSTISTLEQLNKNFSAITPPRLSSTPLSEPHIISSPETSCPISSQLSSPNSICVVAASQTSPFVEVPLKSLDDKSCKSCLPSSQSHSALGSREMLADSPDGAGVNSEPLIKRARKENQIAASPYDLPSSYTALSLESSKAQPVESNPVESNPSEEQDLREVKQASKSDNAICPGSSSLSGLFRDLGLELTDDLMVSNDVSNDEEEKQRSMDSSTPESSESTIAPSEFESINFIRSVLEATADFSSRLYPQIEKLDFIGSMCESSTFKIFPATDDVRAPTPIGFTYSPLCRDLKQEIFNTDGNGTLGNRDWSMHQKGEAIMNGKHRLPLEPAASRRHGPRAARQKVDSGSIITHARKRSIEYVYDCLKNMEGTFTMKSKIYQTQLKSFLPEPIPDYQRYILNIPNRPLIPANNSELEIISRLQRLEDSSYPQKKIPEAGNIRVADLLEDFLTSIVNKTMFLVVVEHETWYIHAPARDQLTDYILEFIWPSRREIQAHFRPFFSGFIEVRVRHFRDSVARHFREKAKQIHREHSDSLSTIHATPVGDLLPTNPVLTDPAVTTTAPNPRSNIHSNRANSNNHLLPKVKEEDVTVNTASTVSTSEDINNSSNPPRTRSSIRLLTRRLAVAATGH